MANLFFKLSLPYVFLSVLYAFVVKTLSRFSNFAKMHLTIFA